MSDYDAQNIGLGLALPAALLALLWAASHSDGVTLLLLALTFAFLGLTNYALIHEACHENLHTNRRINTALGTLTSWLFPVSFSFMQVAHDVHHLNNRTDGEMFDYFYPEDNRIIKYGQWYSILIGIYPPIIPLGSVLMAVMPGFFRLKPWRAAKSSSIIFDRSLFTRAVVAAIRREVVLGVLFWVAAWWILDLELMAVGILYAAFWFNWSTRQYVSHAFSPRDVLNGAWNLRVSPVMGWIFLNGQWDLVHHLEPGLRWQDLPAKGATSRTPIPYWRQYLRLWAGPRPNTEAAPLPLDALP